jgi:hypothetical protein
MGASNGDVIKRKNPPIGRVSHIVFREAEDII